jgi:hypothetical protein
MFVQIHTLRDYSTALPNRGQDGLAKRTIYGGVERQRISSQSFKAALRDNPSLVRVDNDGSLVSDGLVDLASRLGLSMSVRSAMIGERRLFPLLRQKGLTEEEARGWSSALMALWQAKPKSESRGNAKNRNPSKDPDNEDDQDDGGEPASQEKKDAPLVVGEKEIAALAECALALKTNVEPSKIRALFESQRSSSATPDAVKAVLQSLSSTLRIFWGQNSGERCSKPRPGSGAFGN